MNQAMITVTFYSLIDGEIFDTLKKKYIVRHWHTDEELQQLTIEIAHELHYLSGYGIWSIHSQYSNQVNIVTELRHQFTPYREQAVFSKELRFAVGEYAQSGRTIWFEIPHISEFISYNQPMKMYDPDDPFFSFKGRIVGHTRKRERQAGTELYLEFDEKNPILWSFLHKIYHPGRLLPYSRSAKYWELRELQTGTRPFISFWTLPNHQITTYKWEQQEKQQKKKERAQHQKQQQLKQSGVI